MSDITRNRLPRHHHVHRREQALFPARNKRISSSRQLSRRLRRAQRRQSQRLHRPQKNPDTNPPDTAHPQHPEEITQSLRASQIASERRIPRPPIRNRRHFPLSEILLVLDNEASFLHRFQRFFPGDHVRYPIASLDSQADLTMVLVALVVRVRHHPLVNPEDAAWFQHAENLRVNGFKGGSVDGGFDGVGCVEGVRREVDFLGAEVSELICHRAREPQQLSKKKYSP
jgi:hypothetical protein